MTAVPDHLFTDDQILMLYEEFSKQDKDLKAFLEEKGLSAHYKAITTRFGRLERKQRKLGKPSVAPVVSRDIVKATVEEEVATEARSQTAQLLILGKAVMSAYYKYAAAHGLNIEEIKKTPIHEIIIRALAKEPKYDALVERNRELEDALQLAMQEVNPLFRLKSAIQLMNEFLLFVDVAESIGLNVGDSPLLGYYQNLLETYLKGGS